MQEGSTTTLERVGTQHEVYALSGVDFTVVGVLGTPREGAPDELVPLTDATTVMTTTAPLFSCAAQDGATRLEPGDYSRDVSRRGEVATDGVRREVRIRTGPYLTIPEGPETGDAEALPAVALSGEVPGCFERFDGPPSATRTVPAPGTSLISIAVGCTGPVTSPKGSPGGMRSPKPSVGPSPTWSTGSPEGGPSKRSKHSGTSPLRATAGSASASPVSGPSGIVRYGPVRIRTSRRTPSVATSTRRLTSRE